MDHATSDLTGASWGCDRTCMRGVPTTGTPRPVTRTRSITSPSPLCKYGHLSHEPSSTSPAPFCGLDDARHRRPPRQQPKEQSAPPIAHPLMVCRLAGAAVADELPAAGPGD
eukprot:6271229-Prymnesium_polylepis.1